VTVASEGGQAVLDWDKDELKHYVRLIGWLPACQARWRRVNAQVRSRSSPRKKPLKYFTLCASKAVDVFMLEQAGVVSRSPATARLENVYFCEEDADEYRKVIERVGENGFLGPLEGVILFEDDPETLKFTLADNPPRPIRQKLEIKEQHGRLIRAFPFDVINLDVCGPFFPPKAGKISPMLKAVRRILEWQRNADPDEQFECDEFTLLLTSYIDKDAVNKEALDELVARMKDNLARYGQFREAYESKWPATAPSELAESNFPTFFSLALPKVLIRDAIERGWKADYRGILLYERVRQCTKERYWMMSSVTHFARLTNTHTSQTLRVATFETYADLYASETSEIVRLAPVAVNKELADGQTTARVKDHLAKVITFREKKLASLRAPR
jgi:hypothetical protein